MGKKNVGESGKDYRSVWIPRTLETTPIGEGIFE